MSNENPQNLDKKSHQVDLENKQKCIQQQTNKYTDRNLLFVLYLFDREYCSRGPRNTNDEGGFNHSRKLEILRKFNSAFGKFNSAFGKCNSASAMQFGILECNSHSEMHL